MRKFLPILLLLTAVILTGCRREPPAPTAAPTVPVTVSPTTEPPTEPPTEAPTEPLDPEEVSWVQHTLRPQNKRTEFLTGRRDAARYYFEMSAWEADACETASEKMVTFLAGTRALSGLAPEKDSLMVYTGDSITTWQQPGMAYLNTEDVGTLPAFWTLFQAENPSISHAGLAYGLTAGVAGEMNLCDVPSYDNAAIRSFLAQPENGYLLDMTLPVLEPRFVPEETANMMQAAACSLADFCAQRDGMEALMDLALHGEDEALTALTRDWMQSIGLEPAYTRDHAEHFYYGPDWGSEYPYCLDTPSAIWCFWSADVLEWGYDAFMEEYRTVSDLAEQDFQEAQIALEEVQRKEVNRIHVYTEFTLEDTMEQTAAFYNEMDESIHIYFDWDNALYSIVHEYMHHLTIGKGKLLNTWSLLTEAIAEEAALFASANRCEQAYFEEIRSDFEQMGLVNEDGSLDLAGYTYLRAEMYSKGYEQAPYLCIAQFVRERPEPLTADALTYPEAASLMHYLVETYGRTDAYVNSTGIKELEAFIEMPFAELYAQWQAWNTAHCHELGYYL